jgi:thiopeptide-type bacteriocin biosynthesis protein
LSSEYFFNSQSPVLTDQKKFSDFNPYPSRFSASPSLLDERDIKLIAAKPIFYHIQTQKEMKTSIYCRTPLLDFDIEDENQINLHFSNLLEAIRISFKPFYHQIKNKKYHELSPNEKSTLYKYMNRGKYRATPFDLWSASALADWGKPEPTNLADFQFLTTYPCPSEWLAHFEIINNHITTGYACSLNPSITQTPRTFKFYYFDIQSKSWLLKELFSDNFLSTLYSLMSPDKKWTFNFFLKSYPDKSEAHPLWFRLIREGFFIINKINKHTQSNLFGSTPDLSISNSFLNTKILIPKNINLETEDLINSIDKLFAPSNSKTLNNLTSFFSAHFDDRFVPLKSILDPRLGLEDALKNQLINLEFSKIPHFLLTDEEEIDLEKYISNKPLKNHRSISLAFKVNSSGQIIVDNIVAGRALSYFGRFAYEKSTSEFIQDNIISPLTSKNWDYLEVQILETPETQILVNPLPLFRKVLRINSPTKSLKNEVPLDSILIGLVKGQFLLMDKNNRRQLVPIFPHAISYTFITHPLHKFLWQVSMQNTPKFITYQNTALSKINYLPRLKWKNIILQSRKWEISIKKFPHHTQLKDFLSRRKIPNQLIVGKLDRELHLDWQNSFHFDLLWKELNKHSTLAIRENLCTSSPFKSTKGNMIYPQFIWTGINENYTPPSLPQFVNVVDEESIEWKAFHIYGSHSSLKLFLTTHIPALMEKYPGITWFYLPYADPEFHVKLRFKINHSLRSFAFESELLFYAFNDSNNIKCLPAKYFPETLKFSSDTILQSEQIFYLESSNFLKSSGKILHSDLDTKINFAVAFWVFTMPALKMENEFLSSMKKQIKNWNREERSNFNTHYQASHKVNINDHFDTTEFWLNYIRPLKKALQHSSSKLFLLQNHIHLFCLRLFFEDMAIAEKKVHYLCYRQLSKNHHLSKIQNTH